MTASHRTPVLRKDYQASSYYIESVYLVFQLEPLGTQVTATTQFYRNDCYDGDNSVLQLHGEELELIDIAINNMPLQPKRYRLEKNTLKIYNPPEKFTLTITNRTHPENNTSLSGLYRSSGNYCTQCEAEGFRRITYYLDRPDVLARFTTRIEADKKTCPVLLSNGNCLEQGNLDSTRHYAIWQDPYPKPSYLFALVAGNLVAATDRFITRSGREVTLLIYVEKQNRHKCDHAMVSLKKAMKWDEEVYGLEYDLDIYMIVAVDDFNMGAMENKGLNIFNSKYVLASPESATDNDFMGIEGVIAHEYFHNWTGNRVTCRDWFQLSLKEGLTVFRDQEFSADMNSRPVQRIDDVNILRNAQFREDASPMAHPVRPDSYVEINNFYTVTVYNKGAEVIRMLHKIIGAVNFRQGMDLYFQRFDGQAVTCDDFVEAMADASGVDLEQFKLWYSQAGTPVLTIAEKWQEGSGKYNLQVAQSCPPTPGQESKKPFHIPIDIGLLVKDDDGAESGRADGKEQCHSLELKTASAEYQFTGFLQKPTLSFLRDFTAPVKVSSFQSKDERAHLMACDTNLFNRWNAAFQLSAAIVREAMEVIRGGGSPVVETVYRDAFFQCLTSSADPALIAKALTLPSESYLAQQQEVIDPDLLHRARLAIKQQLTRELRESFAAVYRKCDTDKPDSISSEDMAKRSLKNCCLSYLLTPGVEDSEGMALCLKQFNKNGNMTDVVASLTALSGFETEEKNRVFQQFYEQWQYDPLVVDKWLAIQATSSHPSTLTRVKELLQHEAFTLDNPNKVRSLIGAFCSLNHRRFHDESGAGYRFLVQQVLQLDKKNPQIAARLLTPLVSHGRYTLKLKTLMEEQLRFFLLQDKLSADVEEIVRKSLQQ
jgi:aminopeptidase N